MLWPTWTFSSLIPNSPFSPFILSPSLVYAPPPTSLRMKAGVLVSAHVWGCRRGASNPVIPSPPILNHPDRGFLTTVQYSTVYTATLLSRPLSHLPTPQTPPTFHRRSVVFSSTHLTSGPKPTVSSSSLIFPPRKHLDTPLFPAPVSRCYFSKYSFFVPPRNPGIPPASPSLWSRVTNLPPVPTCPTRGRLPGRPLTMRVPRIPWIRSIPRYNPAYCGRAPSASPADQTNRPTGPFSPLHRDRHPTC
jgi:hypothetical protein